MKLNLWIVAALAPLTSVLLLAQDTPTAPAAPAKKASSVKRKVVLDPPAAATVKTSDLNVRGRSSFAGETLGHVQKGDTVTVLEQITLSRPTKDEPAEWAKISLPVGIPVWVAGNFVDAETKTIKARRINLRGGPGENFSIVGRLEKGAVVKEIKKEKGWVAIEAPTNAYAYVAAEFLEMQPPPAVVVTAPPPAPAPAPAPVPVPVPAPTPEPQVVNVNTPAPPAVAAPEAPAPTTPKSEKEQELEALHRATAAEDAPAPVPAPAAVTEITPAPTPAPEPVKPRIVTREGFVRRAYNIQSPSDFELHDVQSGKLIDYLQPKNGQNFKIFVGTRVTVTGPEDMDPRWMRTPVLQVESVDLTP